jgi:hypothetical protein
MNPGVRVLQRQIDKIKRDLLQLELLRFGSLSKQYNVCNTPGCRCKTSPSHKHGPYHQISYTRKGKSSTRAVKREDLAEVKKQIRNYARLRDLVERWGDLATELSDLKLQQRHQEQRPERRGRSRRSA